MQIKVRFENLCKDFKRRKQVGFIILVLVFIVMIPMTISWCISAYRKLGDAEKYVKVLLIILGLYEISLLYKFTKWMSAKERELNRIMQKNTFVKDTKEALYNYDFVKVPEVIFEALSEKSGTVILLFAYYFFAVVSGKEDLLIPIYTFS